MNNLVTLTNVVDIRTGKIHSVVRIKERLAKWFVPAEKEFIHHDPIPVEPEEEPSEE